MCMILFWMAVILYMSLLLLAGSRSTKNKFSGSFVSL